MAGIHATLSHGRWKGAEIITSPYTFSATPAAIKFMGYEPVFVDVDPQDFTITPEAILKARTPKTVAVMPVDLFGGLADYAGIKNLNWSMPIIQDACQAVGATRKWLYGVCAAWSFNGAKNVPAGEAGMLVTDNRDLASRARAFISHGENWGAAEVGINGRLNEITACVAYFGMKEVKANNRRRQALAEILWQNLRSRPEIYVPGPDALAHHALYVYPLVLTDRAKVTRERFVGNLKRMGVEVGQGYITPTLNHYNALPRARSEMPVVTRLSEKTLCLFSQVRPPATPKDMDYIAQCIERALDPVWHPVEQKRKIGHIKDSVF